MFDRKVIRNNLSIKLLRNKMIKRRPSHPGEILKIVWLDELGYSQKKFAEILSKASKGRSKVSSMQTKLSRLINGKISINTDFAFLLSSVLKTEPKMWINLQVKYDQWVEQNVKT